LFVNFIASRTRGQAAVDISGSDLEGVVLSITGGISIPGVLRLEGRELSTLQGAKDIEVRLTPTGPNEYFQLPRPMRMDGVFSLDNVFPGEYHVTMARLPEGVYLKQARFDTVDVLRQPLVISGRTEASLAITLSANGGQIEGKLMNDESRPVSGSRVVLVPDQNRDRASLFKSAISDQNGRFLFSGITPGEYRIFAWEAIGEFEYFDPDLLRQSEQRGTAVSISESARVTVEVTINPATQ
jgi:hypothetical protein